MATRSTMRKQKQLAAKVENTIASLVRRLEKNYTQGVTTHSKYVQMSMYEDLCKIDAYLNSKHTSGSQDSMGRDKPFFNIVTAAVNIWYRATDIDRKNINIRPTKASDVLGSFIGTVLLRDWMRRENFGYFLNDWGRALARYGSSVIKFIEKDGKLHCIVLPWNRLIVDTIDFDGNLKIEVIEVTEAQLRLRPGYNKAVVDALCQAHAQRRTLDGQTQDNNSDYIKLYEVHGVMPLSRITEKPRDEDTYVQQMHVVSFVAKKQNSNEYDEFTLIKGREKKEPNMITHLIKEDGQTLSIGAVQHLFEAQWMVNHTAKAIKDQLDLASKLIFQTADTNFVGQNALTAIETGDILIHAEGMPLAQLGNNSHDIVSLQNFGQQWKALAQDITSTPDAISGGTMPSGTAYRQVAILNTESHSLFEMMTENKGLYIEQMLREFIIPFLKKNIKHSKQISAILSDNEITKIDRMYIPNEAARRIQRKTIDALVKGEVPQGLDHGTEQAGVQSELSQLGNERFFVPDDVSDATWAEILKDLEWNVECEITDETTDKEADLATLNTVLQTIAANPNILNDPTARMIFNKILERTGQVSPVELPPATPVAPTSQNVPTPFQTATPQPAAQNGA